jgi:hypothetical protein
LPGKKEFMIAKQISEHPEQIEVTPSERQILNKFKRSKLLDVYFSRLEGRTCQNISREVEEVYAIKLPVIKAYLLGQHPQDSILQKIFRIMS